MEKLKPTYSLATIKASFNNASTLNRSFVSKRGADDLNMDDATVVAVIQALNHSDFEKSMTSYVDTKIWQDVYKPIVAGQALYVKFTEDSQKALFLISFKEL